MFSYLLLYIFPCRPSFIIRFKIDPKTSFVLLNVHLSNNNDTSLQVDLHAFTNNATHPEFSVIEIEQLIIRQTPSAHQEGFTVPDEIKSLNDLTILSITGTISYLPSWIVNKNKLCSLTLSH